MRRGDNMACDMCGNNGRLYVTLVEGTEMQLCDDCKKYGEVKRSIPTVKEAAFKQKQQHTTTQHKARHDAADVFEIIVAEYSTKIKEAREQQNKKQEQLAKQLGIKESQLHKYESGHKRPDLETARKLERALNITLVEGYVEDNKNASVGTSSGQLTIADLMKKR